jgi:hypothetical protein
MTVVDLNSVLCLFDGNKQGVTEVCRISDGYYDSLLALNQALRQSDEFHPGTMRILWISTACYGSMVNYNRESWQFGGI